MTEVGLPRLELIVAVERNGGIGQNNRLPWSLPSEFAYFLRMTQNPVAGKRHAVIMGRYTWISIPPKARPWKNSINFILSQTMSQADVAAEHPQDVYVYPEFQQIIERICSDALRHEIDRVWVLGGSAIYAEAMRSPHFHRLYITKIDAHFPCDVFFPEFHENQLQIVDDDQVPRGVQLDNGVEYRVFVYQTKGVGPLKE